MIAPDETTFEWVRGREGAPADFDAAVARWRAAADRRGRELRHRGRRSTPAAISPMVTWGTNPGMVVEVTDTVPDPAAMDSPADREAAERALAYMGLEAGHADDRGGARTGLHRLLHQLADRGPARGRRDRRRPPGRRLGVRAMVVPGSQQVKAAAEAEGLHDVFRGAGFEWREAGCSMCLGMNPDTLAEGRALRLDLQPQFRGAPGQGRAHPPGQPEDGRSRRHRGTFRRHQGLELSMRPIDVIEGKVSVLDRADVDTDQIIPKQFLKRVERTGFGEFLFYDWIRDGEIELEPNPILVTGPQLRLRLLPRARPLGAGGLRLPGDRRAVLRRHLLLQLHEDRAAAGDPRRGALPRGRRGRRGPDRRRRRDGHLCRRCLRVRGRARRQAPAPERARRHRRSRSRTAPRSTASRRPRPAPHGPVTTAL